MRIELTKRQQHALDREDEHPPRVVDPRTNTVYVLIPAGQYEDAREILEDEQRRDVIHSVGLKNAAARMTDNG